MFLSQFQVIVNFPVKDQGQVLVLHGLLTPGNIQDGKPVMMKLQLIIGIGRLFIRTPVPEIFGELGNV